MVLGMEQLHQTDKLLPVTVYNLLVTCLQYRLNFLTGIYGKDTLKIIEIES